MKLEDMRANAQEGKPIDLDRDAAERLRKAIELAKEDPAEFAKLLGMKVPDFAFKFHDFPRDKDGNIQLRVYADMQKLFKNNITPRHLLDGI